ncbi:MAG: hypothetical protein IJV05_04505 [Muribaculaceae bacterium]|nr:hypothetical protein [Muribaculaceae bacterium]
MLPFVGLLLWLCIIIAISLILGLVAALIALPLAKKPKRKRKILLAFLSPGLAIGIWTVCSVVTMLTTSTLCNVDIGLGDTWISPLPNGYEIYSIDLPGNGNIDKVDTSDSITTFYETVSASKLQVIGDTVIGQRADNGDYFLLDTRTDSLTFHESLTQLQASLNGKKIELMDNSEYHWQARRTPYSIGATIALCCIALALFLLWKIGLSSRWDKLYRLVSADTQQSQP